MKKEYKKKRYVYFWKTDLSTLNWEMYPLFLSVASPTQMQFIKRLLSSGMISAPRGRPGFDSRQTHLYFCSIFFSGYPSDLDLGEKLKITSDKNFSLNILDFYFNKNGGCFFFFFGKRSSDPSTMFLLKVPS